jgi:hypothetical protein
MVLVIAVVLGAAAFWSQDYGLRAEFSHADWP